MMPYDRQALYSNRYDMITVQECNDMSSRELMAIITIKLITRGIGSRCESTEYSVISESNFHFLPNISCDRPTAKWDIY